MTEQAYIAVILVFGALLLVLSWAVVLLAHDRDRHLDERRVWQKMYYDQLEKEQETVAQLLKDRNDRTD